MTTEIERSLEAFLRERGPADTSVASRPELGRLAGDLNVHWWREAERVLQRITPEHAAFSPEERLLLDHGVLDWRLVPGGDRNRAACLKELYAEGHAGRAFFSEWIVQRLRQFLLVGGMTPEGEASGTTQLIKDLRGRVYLRLAPLFKALPGFNQQAVDLFLSGRIDESIDALVVKLQQSPDERATEQFRQLSDFRFRILTRAREHARSGDELALFDSLREMDREAREKRASQRLSADARSVRQISDAERLKWLSDELRFVKQVLWLGIMGSGLARTYSILLSSQPRLVKATIEPILALAKQVDPRLVEPASILIAPYAGGGFYEWDRDTLFLPLVPTRDPEHAVIQGLANYRILLDKFQENGAFRKDYEAALGGGEDFGTTFARDYKAWVLGVGKGFKGALDPARYAFFRDRIGPSLDTLYAPREWAGRSPQEQAEILKTCRLQASVGKAGFEDHYKFAVAAWRDRKGVAAIQHLQEALRISPVDGRALLAAGVLSARVGVKDTARLRLQECLSAAPGTLWSVYAAEELQKL